MTNKALIKLNGHRVFIEMHTYPKSAEFVHYTGELIASKGTHSVYRNNVIKTYEHHDFYIDDEKSDKLILIEWNKVKLITYVQDLGRARK